MPKPEPRVLGKRDRRLTLAQKERDCRVAVKARDKGRCVVPGCKERAQHLHHVTYRSRGGKWTTPNICSLCPAHHALVHAAKIQISGDADTELIITGDRKYLEFKL